MASSTDVVSVSTSAVGEADYANPTRGEILGAPLIVLSLVLLEMLVAVELDG